MFLLTKCSVKLTNLHAGLYDRTWWPSRLEVTTFGCAKDDVNFSRISGWETLTAASLDRFPGSARHID